VVLTAGCLVLAVAAIAYAAGQMKAARVLRAERFELVDSSGRMRAELGTAEQGDLVYVRLFGTRGDVRADLEADERIMHYGGGVLRLSGNNAREGSTAALSCSVGGPYLYMTKSTQGSAVERQCTVSPDEVTLKAGEPASVPSNFASLTPEEQEKIAKRNFARNDAQRRIRLGLDESPTGRPALQIYDEAGMLRTTLGSAALQAVRTGATTQTAESSLVLFEREGKVLWQAP